MFVCATRTEKRHPGQSTGRGVRLPYLSVQDVFLVAVPEVGPLGNARDGPGEDVQQEQGGDGAEVGKHRVDPDDPEHAGAHDDDDGRERNTAERYGSS